MNTINEKYAVAYNRAFNAIRNRVLLSAGDIGRNIKVRVIGNGVTLQRGSGLMVKLFNTNAMDSAFLAKAVDMLKPENFNLVADAGTEEDVTKYLREAQNLGNIAFSVPVTNPNVLAVGQGASVDATVVNITIQSGERTGQQAIALNFNRVIAAETATSAASAFDALLAGTDVSTPQGDPFAPDTNQGTAPAAKGSAKRKAAVAA